MMGDDQDHFPNLRDSNKDGSKEEGDQEEKNNWCCGRCCKFGEV